MITESMSADFDPHGLVLSELGRTYGQVLTHNSQMVRCRGASTQSEANYWCVSRAQEHYGWKWRSKWWQFWRPSLPVQPEQEQ